MNVLRWGKSSALAAALAGLRLPVVMMVVYTSVAGKTGTTNEGRDAWFVGYWSRLLAVVWVGFDEGEAHGLSGAKAASRSGPIS
jgi:membrane carboxypeptidase/penicillin-binding protein